jgi:hypothetical protein
VPEVKMMSAGSSGACGCAGAGSAAASDSPAIASKGKASARGPSTTHSAGWIRSIRVPKSCSVSCVLQGIAIAPNCQQAVSVKTHSGVFPMKVRTTSPFETP